MSSPLTLFINATPKNDQATTVYENAMAHAQNEEGTLTYRLFRNQDGSFRLYEDYASSEAVLEHMANMQKNGTIEEMLGAFDIQQVEVLGTPTPEAKEALDQLGATYAEHVTGFSTLGRLEATT